MSTDLAAVRAGQLSYADFMRKVGHTDLYEMTDELFETLDTLCAGATDAAVSFEPHDPAASDQSEQGWSLSHVVAHLTATLEEAGTFAALFARGIQAEGRLRAEAPWEQITTLPALQARLQESRRTCRAFLDAWPEQPHLSLTRTLDPSFGPLNAVGIYAFGLTHGHEHLEQLRETRRQYASAEER